MTIKDWRHIGVVTVTAYNGATVEFPCLEDAVLDLGEKHVDEIGDRNPGYRLSDYFHRNPARYSSWDYATSRWGAADFGENFVFHDDLGLRIPAWRIKQAYAALPAEAKLNRWERNRIRNCRHVFRDGPVPGLRGHSSDWHNRPALRQERTYVEAARSETEEIGIRPKGRLRDVPNDYHDERWTGRKPRRCWKNRRRTQYKGGAA